jgi:hypothetical protein
VVAVIEEALANQPHVSRLGIVVVEVENTIVLKGTVPSYFKKQMAQEAAMSALRGRTITLRNEIVVSGLQPAQPAVSSVEATETPRGHNGKSHLPAPPTGQV